MKHTTQLIRLLTVTLLLSALPALFAQAKDDSQRDRMKETVLTGCLNKDSAGSFILTDEKTGAKMTVTGPSDLEKHSANHKVTLTGTAKTDATGKSAFEVSKIQHVSPTCKASE